jgi:hypothetical protein
MGFFSCMRSGCNLELDQNSITELYRSLLASVVVSNRENGEHAS